MNRKRLCWLLGVCALVLLIAAVPIGCGPSSTTEDGTPHDAEKPAPDATVELPVIPVGLPFYHQELLLVEKDLAGRTHRREILGVLFVPLTGDLEERGQTSST